MSFHGEILCQGTYGSGKKSGCPCERRAYYEQGGKFYCGRHSKKGERKELEKNPQRKVIKEEELRQQIRLVEEAAQKNNAGGRRGDVIVQKMYMMKKLETPPGYHRVFPNYLHGSRKDGFGCPSLSPKSLGPIVHDVPFLPPSKNLENWWQFSKCYPFEADEDGKPLKAFIDKLKEGFENPVPQRHKYQGEKQKPLFSVFYDRKGEGHNYSYIEARYFYCKKYEELAIKQKDFQVLEKSLQDGFNIVICGYDGYHVTKSLMEHYLDETKPFGHELVLYTLLTEEEKDYPWNIYYQERKDIYEGVI